MFYTILASLVLTLTQGNVERTQDGFPKYQTNNTSISFYPDSTFSIIDTLDTPKRFTPGPGQLSKDGLKYYIPLKDTIEFHRLYVLSRNNLTDIFDSASLVQLPGNIAKIDTFSNSQPTVTADEKIMVFVKSWDNNWNNNDLWVAIRDTLSGLYDSLRPLSEVNIMDTADAYPWISPNGLRLYFTQGSSLYMASRTSRDSLFGNKEKLALNCSTSILCCFLTNNELEIYFKSGTTIYYAIRNTAKGNFSDPIAIPELGGIGFTAAPSLTPDSSELYLYNVPDTTGKWILKFFNTQKGIEESKELKVQSRELRVVKDKIYLEAPKSINAELKIYDLCGRPKETLYKGTLSKGEYTFTSSIKKSGIYFVRLSAGDVTDTKKMILIK